MVVAEVEFGGIVVADVVVEATVDVEPASLVDVEVSTRDDEPPHAASSTTDMMAIARRIR